MEPLEWARQQLEQMRDNKGSPDAVRDFLVTHAGPESSFTERAKEMPGGGRQDYANARIALRGWIEYAEAGMTGRPPESVRFRVEAATDLLEQVQRLLDDPDVHAAAPVMLAGAALEEHLRGLLAQYPEAEIQGTASIVSYAQALKTSGALDRQDVKELTALAGDRNAAAHGEFDRITLDRARLMVDRVNYFIAQHGVETIASEDTDAEA